MDAKVVLQCRQADLPLVKTAIPIAKEQYQQEMRTQVDLIVDEANCLPENRYEWRYHQMRVYSPTNQNNY